MDPTTLIFLSSGLFLGWSLGSNDAANVFGTAVGSRMVKFSTAAIVCAVFVTLGAVISGAGAAHGLGRLGAVNALPGSFSVALCAAVTVYWMSRIGLPVSTTQAIVGAIVGWNLFSGSVTDMAALGRIVSTWVACPILGAVFALLLYKVTVRVVQWSRLHLIWLDFWTRLGLVLAGAFGAYSLGANNIANVMGVFIPSSPFEDMEVLGVLTLTSTQQLFLVGGLAIAVGTFYSKRVMMTVGTSIMPVSAVGAWVAVVAHSLVLFVFSSTSLQQFLVGLGLPPIPLVPVSSSQAVVGAVIGIGLAHGRRGARQVRWSVLMNIGSGWVSTPIISAVICYVLLFFVQNVFQQPVYEPVTLAMTEPVIEKLKEEHVDTAKLDDLVGTRFTRPVDFRRALREHATFDADTELRVTDLARCVPMRVDASRLETLPVNLLTPADVAALRALDGQSFEHAWQLRDAWIEARSAPALADGGAVDVTDVDAIEAKVDQLIRHWAEKSR